LKKSTQVDFLNAEEAKHGLIKGLYVFDEFITKDEEDKMLLEIDTNKWTKLMNRRV